MDGLRGLTSSPSTGAFFERRRRLSASFWRRATRFSRRLSSATSAPTVSRTVLAWTSIALTSSCTETIGAASPSTAAATPAAGATVAAGAATGAATAALDALADGAGLGAAATGAGAAAVVAFAAFAAFAGAGAATTTGATTASTAFATFFVTAFGAAGTEADIIPEAVVLLIARIRTLTKHNHSILGQSL